MLPHLVYHRSLTNYVSPNRTSLSKRGQKPLLRSIDLLGLALWFLKSRDPIYELCVVFGVTLS